MFVFFPGDPAAAVFDPGRGCFHLLSPVRSSEVCGLLFVDWGCVPCLDFVGLCLFFWRYTVNVDVSNVQRRYYVHMISS